jgi:hypothetical protein
MSKKYLFAVVLLVTLTFGISMLFFTLNTDDEKLVAMCRDLKPAQTVDLPALLTRFSEEGYFISQENPSEITPQLMTPGAQRPHRIRVTSPGLESKTCEFVVHAGVIAKIETPY